MYVPPGSLRARRSLALDTELLLLRKRSGFAADRLEKLPNVLRLLGSEAEPFEVVRDRFISAIRSLPAPDSDLLLAVYGLGDTTAGVPTLLERRALYGRTIQRGVDTVAALELPALAGLRSQLVTGWYPDSPVGIRVSDSTDGIVHESVAIRTVIRDGRWAETRERYRFVVVSDDVEQISIATPRLGRPIITGNFEARTIVDDAGARHEFRHFTPMRRGHLYDLQFRMILGGGEDASSWTTEECRAFPRSVRYANFEAVFNGMKPTTAWWVEGSTARARHAEPGPDQALVVRGRSLVAQFQDLARDRAHGLAWRW